MLTALLADPATQYPVVVDPTTTLGMSFDIYVRSDQAASTGGDYLKVGSPNGGVSKMRSLLKFNVASLADKHITAAQLRLWSQDSGSCDQNGPGVLVRRLTVPWEQTSVTWANQPAWTTAGETVVKTSPGYSSACPATLMRFPITAMTQAWADGAANHGVQVRGVSENDVRSYRMFHSTDFDVPGITPNPPVLVAIYNSYPDTATISTDGEVAGTDDVAYTGATPTLYAAATDADGGTMRLDFEVSTATGTIVWTGSSAAVNAGAQASVAIPAGKLADGQAWRWRARGFDGTDYGPWSAYKSHTVDAQAPAAPAIDCPEYPAGAWSATADDAVTCTLDTTSTDGSGYYWALDDANPTTLAADSNGKGGDPLTVTLTPGEGWHTLYAKSRDAALHTSAVSAYAFGVGRGRLLKPADEERTQQAVPLVAAAPSARTGVRYEYRADATGAWAPLPLAHVTPAGSATPIASWPQTRTDTGADFAELSWNLAATMTAIGRRDG
ncbi:DNRLRE domain-containing protein, partial [Planobispora siamensis]